MPASFRPASPFIYEQPKHWRKGPLQHSLGDVSASSREADRRLKRIAALATEGLKTAKDAIPQLSATGKQKLLRFMTALLETYFFPRAHGLVGAQGEVLRESNIGTVPISVIAKEGARWPRFEYRIRLSLSDQILDPELRGRHMTGHFSSIRLFTRALYGTAPARAVLTALHEMTHMMFRMVRSLEHLRGAETAAQFLSREPWGLLDLSGFAGHRGRLERHEQPDARPAHSDEGFGTGRITGRKGVRLRTRCDRRQSNRPVVPREGGDARTRRSADRRFFARSVHHVLRARTAFQGDKRSN